MPKICFVSIDVEGEFGNFDGVEKLDKILSIFKKYNISATLFMTGRVLQKYSQAARQWSQSFEIACHGFFHKFWNELSIAERDEDISRFFDVYQDIFHKLPFGFRAPSHIIDEDGIKLLGVKGFLYDSSIVPHYPPLKKYRGYLGRAPLAPYYPSGEDCRCLGALRILEIPLAGQISGLPLAGAWIAKLPFFIYGLAFRVYKPNFITLSFHSWDILDAKFLSKLEKLLQLMQKCDYQFVSGKDIYEQISKN